MEAEQLQEKIRFGKPEGKRYGEEGRKRKDGRDYGGVCGRDSEKSEKAKLKSNRGKKKAKRQGYGFALRIRAKEVEGSWVVPQK